MQRNLPIVLIIGPTPPPFHGVSVATDAILRSDLRNLFRLEHLDMSDRRGIQHVDKPDFHDVVLFLKQEWRLLTLLRRVKPTVVYLPISQSSIGFLRDSLLILPAWLFGAKVVLHLHGGNFLSWYESLTFLMKAYVRIVLKRVSYMAVLGESLSNLFTGLVAPNQIKVIPNGISWPVIRQTTDGYNQTGRYRILHLSTLCRMKGALVLLAAVPLVLKVRQDVEFIFAGPWAAEADRREAEKIVSDNGLSRYVVFTGSVTSIKHKRLIYSSADLFVFPGVQQEGQPLVVLEAMASGLPVLFTDRGCLRDTVIEGECGFEVRRSDPRSLADRILWCLDHPLEIKRMGVNARDRFDRCYTINRFIQELGDLFTLASGGWQPVQPQINGKNPEGAASNTVGTL
ncbi:MAG: glycosyltransferase family 4 protein [Nitrospirales bacterium]|nr:glycosyltransferase family 4 protein [Nitrospirales bacterium]